MSVSSADAPGAPQTLLVEENGRELLRYSPENPGSAFYAGGLGPSGYSFCTLRDVAGSEEKAYELLAGPYWHEEGPRVLLTGRAPPALLPRFFVFNQKLHCAAGTENGLALLEIDGYSLDSTNISRVLGIQLGESDIDILSAEPFYSADAYGFLAETGGREYVYFLNKGIISKVLDRQTGKTREVSAPPPDSGYAGGWAVTGSERIVRDAEILGSEYAQFDNDPLSHALRLHFWDTQDITVLGMKNHGTVEFDYRDNTLRVLLITYDDVDLFIGVGVGPVLDYTVDLTANVLLSLRFEDVYIDGAEGGSFKFPAVSMDELLEWAGLFYGIIQQEKDAACLNAAP